MEKDPSDFEDDMEVDPDDSDSEEPVTTVDRLVDELAASFGGNISPSKSRGSDDKPVSPFTPNLPIPENEDFAGLQFSPMRGEGSDDEGEDA